MKLRNFFQYFTQRLKLSLRSVRSSQEVWHVFTNRAKLILYGTITCIVLFIGAFILIAYSSINDIMPGYPGANSRTQLIAAITKLDSLQREVQLWENYSRDLRDILEGKEIPARYLGTDSIGTKIHSTFAQRSVEDSLFRLEVESSKETKILNSTTKELSFEMIAPIEGVIVTPFTTGNNQMGIGIEPKADALVLAVMDGTVIYSDWSPNSGYITIIQHAASMVSIYKNMQGLLLNQGTRIKAGQGIGTIEVDAENPKLFYFELWSAGNAVDPENYLTIQ